MLSDRMAEVAKEAGLDLSEREQERVFKLALAYAEDDDPIGKAFGEYQEMLADAEKGVLGKKLAAPKGAEGPGGVAATATEPIKTFKEAEEAARQRIRASLQT